MSTHAKSVPLVHSAALLVALAAPAAFGQWPDGGLKEVPIDDLKRVYLGCNGAAVDGRLNTAEIMACSLVYEELKQRAFDGDFDKLLAWSRAQTPCAYLASSPACR